MNIDKILAVADAIENHTIADLGFNMGTFVGASDNEIYKDNSGHSCGTVACIAGYGYAMVTGKVNLNWQYDAHPVRIAAKLMGLDGQQAEDLFYGHYSDGINQHPSQLDLDTITPQQAVRCLRNLAITGKVDWLAAMKDDEPELPAVPAKTPSKETV